MTGILFGPISVRTAENSVCSSSAAAAGAEPAAGGGGGGDRGGGGDAELLLELLDELADLDKGHGADRVEDLVLGEGGHVMVLLRV